ncbi:MAG: hypothetical protein AB1425_03035 [Actinomycetota bacterium]
MESLLNITIEALRTIPFVLAFYVPALVGVVIWHEKVPGYRTRAALTFAIGFALIVGVLVLFSGASAVQVLAIIGTSLVYAAVALVLAALTVYKVAD